MQAYAVKQCKDINNLNVESIVSIELYIAVSAYNVIEHTEY